MKKQIKSGILLLALILGMAISSYGQLLTESFDGATFPPTGWAISSTSTLAWSRVTAGTFPTQTPHSGAGEAQCNSFSVSSGTASLVTPVLNFTATNYTVSFWMYRDAGYASTADKVDVYANTVASTTGATLMGTVNRSMTLAPVVATAGWYQYSFQVPCTFTGATNYIICAGTPFH